MTNRNRRPLSQDAYDAPRQHLKVTECEEDTYPYSLAGCQPDTCRHDFDVSVECADGYEGDPAATVCEGHGQVFTIDSWHHHHNHDYHIYDHLHDDNIDHNNHDHHNNYQHDNHYHHHFDNHNHDHYIYNYHHHNHHHYHQHLYHYIHNHIHHYHDDLDDYNNHKHHHVYNHDYHNVHDDDGHDSEAGVFRTAGYLVSEHNLIQEEFKEDSTYKLKGCEKKVFCFAPTVLGYHVDENSLVMQAFDVTAKCADGFHGTAKVTPCSKEGEYSITGCTENLCTAPSTVGYAVKEVELREHSFKVKMTSTTTKKQKSKKNMLSDDLDSESDDDADDDDGAHRNGNGAPLLVLQPMVLPLIVELALNFKL
ncbi:unnamed protein product [Symbiodinium necroappetens]|uniref:Uncharacterized protein n=1 Tax=Symbiodinium necroappetens TaxID=1628268 RepID=A0A812WCR9_9DINO|nr:unnamed protein product [Symbiodinium necroappetens]